jgi:hypothetical protein
MLEEAVRWVIIIIIFVFDPLAVLLLIAAQYTFEFRKKELEDDDGERLRRERAEYERARAQRIIDNPVYNIDTPAPPAEQKEELNDDGDNTGSQSKVEGLDGEPTSGTAQPRGTTTNGMAVAREDDTRQVDQTKGEIDGTVVEPTDSDIQDGDVEHNERDREADDAEGLSGRSDVEPAEEQVPNSDQTQEQTDTKQDTGGSTGEIPDTKNRMFYPEELTEPKKKLELHEELKRTANYEAKENTQEFQDARQNWKTANPDQTLKHYKKLYIAGVIDSLPWEDETIDDNYNSNEGYTQNAEQSENTLFNKLKK